MWADSKIYYKYVQNFLFSDEEIRDCPPPYNNYANPYCFNLSIFDQNVSHIDNSTLRLQMVNASGRNATIYNPPEVLKCYTGLIPFYCPTIAHNIMKEFTGYLQKNIPQGYV